MRIYEKFYRADYGDADTGQIIGFINDDGDVIGSQTAEKHSILLLSAKLYGFSAGDRTWRAYKDDSIVRWWEEMPGRIEKDLVDEFLDKRYNIKVKGHTIQGMNLKKPPLMEEIKKLVMEGIREKALEDFIKKTIHGTEWQGKVFIAGGYVRDEFMGKDPKDLDLLVNAPDGGVKFAEWITQRTGTYKAGSNPVLFPTYGTSKFNLNGIVHNGIDLTGMDIEAVMPRKEQYTAGSRKPIVTGGELKDDVERRDFTVNSLLKDLSTGEILDLTGMGKADILAGIVRTPLSPD